MNRALLSRRFIQQDRKNLVDRKHGRKSDNRKTGDAIIIWTMSAVV